MIYNKPRDVKLRRLPSVGALIKKTDSIKARITKGKSNDDTDKLILLNNTAVPQNDVATAKVVIPESTKSTTQNDNKDFDIILTEPPKASEHYEDIIIDLTQMPVIEGIPILRLPDEPQHTTPAPHKEIVFLEHSAPQQTKQEVDFGDSIIDLSDIPDIDGIPMLELKPVDEEKIQLLEDFRYAPSPKTDTIKHVPARPSFDDEQITAPVIKYEQATEITPEPVLAKITEIEEAVPEPVTEVTTEIDEIIPEPVIEEIAGIEETISEPVAEEIAEIEETTSEPATEEIAEVEETTSEPATEEIAEVEEALSEPVTEELAEVEETISEPVTEEIPEVEEALSEPVTEVTTEIEETTSEPVIDKITKAEEPNLEANPEIAPPPFVQTKAKQGRKAKKKENQRKKADKKKLSEPVVTQVESKEKADTQPTKEEKKKEKKQKKQKPVITNKRRHIKKQGVKVIKLIRAKKENATSKKPKDFGKSRKLKVASFLIMLYAGTILAFMVPLRPTYSETEKRNLASFPEFSVSALVSGDYFANIDTWFSDTFPFRERLTRADTFIKSLYGIDTVSVHGEVDKGDEIPDAPVEVPQPTEPEVTEPVTMPDDDELSKDNGNPNAVRPDVEVQSLNAIVVAGDSAYEYYSFSQDIAPRFIDCVNKLDSVIKPKGDVYAMIVPTSMDITLNDALRAEVNSANQQKALNYFNASFKNAIAVDGIYDAERQHRNEYTYFRTDHHWTALGAYYAYEQFAIEKGIDPIPISKYKTQKFDNFIGTFYSSSGQNSALRKNPDYVTAYLPFNNVTCEIVDKTGNASFEWDVITDVTEHNAGSKYLTFIGGDNALTTITNHDLPQGETCIVIKESYGNAFVPFLIPHYSKIYVIDPRHYSGTLATFCERKQIDDVIFLTNISTTRNYIFLEGLENLVQ